MIRSTCKTVLLAIIPASAALMTAGCFTVKTESEIKPIHITMDINLKVDKELDKAFADEKAAKPKGKFAEVKGMLDRKVAGVTSRAMLEARPGATDDDKILIAESNGRRLQKFTEISKTSGVGLEAVQKRYARQMRERIPAGSGVWYQDDVGKWRQK